MNKRLTKVSKYLSFVLCHEPGSIGLELAENGFVSIETLVSKANDAGKSITEEQVKQVIEKSEEKRFELSEDAAQIRAVGTPPKSPTQRKQRSNERPTSSVPATNRRHAARKRGVSKQQPTAKKPDASEKPETSEKPEAIPKPKKRDTGEFKPTPWDR